MRIRTVAFALGITAGLSVGPALALDRPGVDQLRDKAAAILEEQGIEAGSKFLGDPANGFLDLQGPGLHTWSMNRQGRIVFDHSGQTTPDMDLSTLSTPNGEMMVPKTFKYADQPNGSGYDEPTAWPHPVTGTISNSYLSCKTLKTNKDVAVCAMAWID